MTVLRLSIALMTVFAAGVTQASAAQDSLPDDADALYVTHIKPLLKARCYACHGALKQESGLRLDTVAEIHSGSDLGPVVIRGDVAGSHLLERVTSTDLNVRMPPEGEALSADQIAAITTWIQSGAVGPENEQPDADPRDHWAFRPLTPPVVPTAHPGTTGAKPNPIDAFINARHLEQQLTPLPAAAPEVQLRRLYLDLIGLPPTRDELLQFLADQSPDAYERVVDRLLADPRHGERWARHWMDVWRYADWYGRRAVPDVWNSAPQIWRWRDWIVQSVNDDKGYDRMIHEMLAADEFCPDNDDAAVATGYLIRNWYALNPNDWMRNTVEHTGKAFLGLTFNCAHCHDHKYDPITQDDYFRMRAFFEPMDIRQDQVPGEADPGPFQQYEYVVQRKVQRLGMVRIYDRKPDAPTWFYTGGDERNRVTDRGSIAPGVPQFLATAFAGISPQEHPAEFRFPALRPAMVAARRRELATLRTDGESMLTTEAPTGSDREAAEAAVATARAEFVSAAESARRAGKPGAIAGLRSLHFNALSGRRMVHRSLPELTELPEASEVRFLVHLITDSHFNLQLARDLAAGGTATYIGFENGQIISYQPGSFTELKVGRFDVAAGQNQFAVAFRLDRAADRCVLTVRSTSDNETLVDAVPVALNGWNPAGNPAHGLLMDARTGSVAVVDDLAIVAPATSNEGSAGLAETTHRVLFAADFEGPQWTDGDDIAGVDGWVRSSYSVDPATSRVTSVALNEALRAQAEIVRTAEAAVEHITLPSRVAQARIEAADAETKAFEACLALTLARAAMPVGADGRSQAAPVSDAAAILEAAALLKSARLRTAEASELSAKLALVRALGRPADDAARAREIATAEEQLAAARTAKETVGAATSAAQGTADSLEAAMQDVALGPEFPAVSTGRRLALALWITSEHNPLTARVAINHIWMRHFHSPLVSTVFDFGRNAATPTHPELLDWLACELRDQQWSMKHIHRLIVTSAAYRRQSGGGPETEAAIVDPDNRWLWRMNVGRMEAEVVRDSLLCVAGKLDLTRGGQELENSEALTTFRRSLYYSSQPEGDGRSAFGLLFDAPDALDCYRRTESIIPQQALALTNSELVHTMAKAVSDGVAEAGSSAEGETGSKGDGEFVTRVFLMVLSREPSEAEMVACVRFLATTDDGEAGVDATMRHQSARESLVRAILNHNDFVCIR